MSIITSVAKDHQAFLGNTIEQIASHKAGIIKPMIPVILGELEESAYQVILEEAKKKNKRRYIDSDLISLVIIKDKKVQGNIFNGKQRQ